MAIMNKLLKRQQVAMDLAPPAAKQSSAECVREGEEPFTAEHVLQLCKFLAEKSRRNKARCTQQQGNLPKLLHKHKHPPLDKSKDANGDPHLQQIQRLPDAEATAEAPLILTDKLAPALGNATNTTNNASSYSSTQTNRQADKRDILLKIRRQIFERKRRQLAHVQQRIEVWRPW